MSLARVLNQSVRALDEFCSSLQVRVAERGGALICLFLHHVFTDEAEVTRDLVYPQESVTAAHLLRVIRYFQAAGYRFVSNDEVIGGLPSKGRHVLLSFDDGYFNNRRALPILEQFHVPALFFIPAQLVAEGRAYWWDVLYRARRRRGHDRDAVFLDIAYRVAARNEDIEARLFRELGVNEFKAVGETDRLFTPAELRQFAAHPLVSIGNHGCVHEHLISYPLAEAADRILRAQELLREMTGKTPTAIAYPYGVVSNAVAQASQDAGLKLGFTTELRKNYVATLRALESRMRINRFTVLGNADIERQCRLMRGDLMIHARYRKLVELLKQRRQ